MADPKVKVVIEAVDKATKVLGSITKTIVGGLGIAGVAALSGIAVGAVKAGQAFIGMAVDAAKLSGVQNTFENLSLSIGSNSVSAIESLRDATRGMVSDMDLMAAGNQFMAMGLANTEDEMSNLAEIATQLGSAMGSGPTESMENFSLLLANQSIPRLDSFGISSGTVRSKIEELQKANQGMSRETAFMTAVMEEAEVTLGKVGEQGDTSAAAFARMSAVSANLKTAIGQGLEPVVTNVISTFGKIGQTLMPGIRTIAAGVGAMLNQVFELLKTFGKSILKALGVDFQAIAGDSESWGQNVVLSLARGMAAAIQAVVNVLMQLGNVIRGWLAPGSPPKLLPNLDSWGAEAATVYMDGWGDADFGVFDSLSGTIGGYLRSLSEDVIPKEMLIPWLNTFNAEIANGINSLRETGTVGRDVFDDLIDSAEFLPESIKDYARSLVDVEIAQELFNQTATMMEDITEANRSELESLVATADTLPQPFADYATALLDAEVAQDAFNSVSELMESITDANSEELKTLLDTTTEMPQALAAYAQSILNVESAQNAFNDASELMKDINDANRSELEALAVTVSGLATPFSNYVQSLLAVENAQDTVNNLSEQFDDIVDANRDALESMLSTADNLPQPFGDYVTALLDVEFAQDALEASMQELERATADVSQAQDRLNDVTSEFNAILAPLTAQMKELEKRKQAIEDEEKLAELQAIVSSERSTANEIALAEIEMQQIALRQ